MSIQDGMGVMIANLGGNEDSAKAAQAAVGKEIASLQVDDENLSIGFTDGTGLQIFDDGQSCCESRYMKCDDDLSPHIGATWTNAEVRDGPESEGEYGEVKQCQFLWVTTSRGQFTVANYNEHNGYYGGFAIRCRAWTPPTVA